MVCYSTKSGVDVVSGHILVHKRYSDADFTALVTTAAAVLGKPIAHKTVNSLHSDDISFQASLFSLFRIFSHTPKIGMKIKRAIEEACGMRLVLL